MSEVYQKIAEKMPNMSKAQEKIAKYILSNPNRTPFLTVEKLAKLSGVSIATITRFVIFLGYKGYPDFLRDTQESIQEQVTSSERIKLNAEIKEECEKNIYEVFENDLNNIKSTMEDMNLYEIKRAVNEIINSKRIYIVARRSAYSLGVLLKYYLDFVFNNVYIIENTEDIPKYVDKYDLVIGINFEKYSRSAVEVFSYLKSKGSRTIAITDSMLSPIVPYADVSLTVISKGITSLDSFAAPISLINALVVSVKEQKNDCFVNNVELLEETYKKFDILI